MGHLLDRLRHVGDLSANAMQDVTSDTFRSGGIETGDARTDLRGGTVQAFKHDRNDGATRPVGILGSNELALFLL
jgi:hypothetical protein